MWGLGGGEKQARILSSEGARNKDEDDKQVLFPQDRLAVTLKWFEDQEVHSGWRERKAQ